MAHKQDRETPKTGLDRWNATESKPHGSKGGSAARPGRSKRRRMNPTVRRYVSTLVVTAVLCVACAFCFTPLGERITTGLDIQGGVSVILTASKPDGSTPSADEINTAKTIVEKRVNTLGASEATVQIQGANSILVQIPGATDADSAVQTIGQTGHLEFVRLDDIGDADALAKIEAGASNVKLEQGTYTAFLDGSYIESTSVAQSSTSVGTYSVNITFNSEGADIFDQVTKELAPTNGQICIVLDGVIQSAPAVQEEISGGKVSITGNFTNEAAQELKTVLDSGSLPVSLNYSESRVVGPTLGQDSLNQGVLALVIGVAIVIVYLFFFYRGLGLLTLGSLAVFAILYLGLLAILSHYGMFSLSLPGLAGMVLTTGSAADSSILVLERFREEIRMGRTVKNASVSGARHGIMTSLDADIVTLVTALALFFVGTGTVKGFGLTLALGVACDIVTMFVFKAPALRILAAHVIPSHPGFWGVDQDIAEAERRSQEAQKARGAKAPASSAKGGEARA